MKVEKLSYNLEVKTPTGDQCLITNTIYRNCEIWIRERKLLADFISLGIKGYDVIIGMSWLVRYYIRLNCMAKVVKFYIPREATLKLNKRCNLVSSALILRIWI